jgi:hypothetical protein
VWGYWGIPSWLPTFGGPTSAQQTDSYNNAVANLFDKIRGNTDLSVDLAQWSKTRMIGHDCTKVVTSLLKARNPINIIKAIGSARLTWVYGVKPTLSSIYDAVTFEAKHYTASNGFPMYGKGQSKTAVRNQYRNDSFPNGAYSNYIDYNVSVRDMLGVIMRIPDSPLTSLARLSSLNPASIAWELMPFSFVIDWFVNIGGYVRDLETALVYDKYFVQGFRTTTSRVTLQYRCLCNYSIPYGGGVYWPEDRASGHWSFDMHRSKKDRALLGSLPYPKLPVFNCNLGSGRLFNAAALMTNFLKSPEIVAGLKVKSADRQRLKTQMSGSSRAWESTNFR